MSKENVEVMEQECQCGEGCQCGSSSKCEKVCHCVYKGIKLMMKAATVCAIFHVAKELHKVHKAIEHKECRKH